MNTVDIQAHDIHHIAKSNTNGTDNSFADLLRSIPSCDTVLLTDREQDILNLYDQLSDLRLEHALLQAQQNKGRATGHQVFPSVLAKVNLDQDPELSKESAESQLKALERECLQARSAYLLKNSVIEDTLLVAPLLQAIHGSANTNSLDRLRTTIRLAIARAYANLSTRLLQPLVADRDIVSMAHTNLSAMCQTVMDTLTLTETQSIAILRKNQQLTTDLLGLTDQLEAQVFDKTDNPELRHTLDELQDDAKEARRRWRIMKSLVSAIIAGSGVDWAHDESLRDLVLDDED
ncbi:hypothetical protein MMC17_008765 [Xylographa soralifera]|nr:hypothetical protein [Xylographa soralifera]